MHITILGAGNMGTALAKVITENGYSVALWNYEGDLEPLEQIAKSRENKKYLPGIELSKKVVPVSLLPQALAQASVIFFAVPSSIISSLLKQAAEFIPPRAILVDVSKGLPSQQKVQNKKISSLLNSFIVISGPAIAKDMARKQFTAMNIAGKNKAALTTVRRVLENNYLKLFPCNDAAGIKVAGAIKNIYAILLGICDGLKLAPNTKAVLFAAALKEMEIVIAALGGKSSTAHSLAGLGDLIATGFSPHSRNRRFGEHIASGKTHAQALQAVEQVVEGAIALDNLMQLAKKHRLKLPIAQTLAKIIFGEASAQKEINKLLTVLVS